MKEEYKCVCTLKIPCNNNALYFACILHVKNVKMFAAIKTCPYFHLYISVFPGLLMLQQILCNAFIVPIF